MKNSFLTFALMFPLSTLATDKICSSLAGHFLSMQTTSSVFIGKNQKYFPAIQKIQIEKYKGLCASKKEDQTIISEMYQSCVKLVMEQVKKEELKDLHIQECDLGFRVAEAFVEGFQSN